MYENLNEIVLRPRFKFVINEHNEILLKLFEDTKNSQTNFIVSRVDDHIFIKIPKVKQHFWSPQLHLEINKSEDLNKSIVYGLFGPNPTAWTLFMFLHFVVIALFFCFSVWAFTNWSLETDYAIQLLLSFLMLALWFSLYFGGNIGKKTGTNQMHELHQFMRESLRSHAIHSDKN